MNILLVSSEVSPFAKTGGLGDVSEALPLSLNRLGHNCSVITPFYSLIRTNGYTPHLIKKDVPVRMGRKNFTFDLLLTEYRNIKFYFIRNDALYARDGLYGTPKGDYEDNALRFGFFSRAALAAVPYIGRVDILHCNDWQTALIPVYLKTLFKDDPGLKNIRTLFSIHNMAYQGLFHREVMPLLDIPEKLFTPDGLEFYGKVGFLKAGIMYSDGISTVSKAYAREILTKEFGCGLDPFLKKRQSDIYGILNGADYETWDPAKDKFIIKNYGPGSLDLKADCKKDLVKEFGISYDRDVPLVGMITRLAEQKGLDIVAAAMDELLASGVNFVILGTGDERYNRLFKGFDKKYKGAAGARVTFDNILAHKIEAGCDIFLMPSRYEPCGLNQMYSLKYATVPVVRATGGLDDTIEDFDPKTGKGNGFKFKEAVKAQMLAAVSRAAAVFKDKATWRRLQENGLKCDFSWTASAKEYARLYDTLKNK